MTDPYQIIKLAKNNPYGMNHEGKKNLVMELVEFMSEGQLDNIIDGMKQKYCKEVNKK